jgi:hypothetical protein
MAGEEDGAYRVRVRNTFLDVEEDDLPGAQPDLSRARTEPGRAPPEQSSPERQVPEPVDEGDEEEEGEDELPPQPPLCRWVTQDAFENLSDWQWPTDQPRLEMPSTPPSPMPSTPPPEGQFFGYAPANYVPVPVIPMSVVQSNFTPMAMAMPPMRGMRWPAPQPGGQPVQPYQTSVRSTGIPLDVEAINQMTAATEDMHNKPSADVNVMQVPSMPGLNRQFSTNSQLHRVHWTLPEKKLRASDKTAVSPAFEIYGAEWRIMLTPHVSHSHKGGSSFKTAKGWASIKLKCERRPEELNSLTMMFRFFVGSLPPRGPATHDFTQRNIGSLSSSIEFWDLLSEVKNGTVTLGCEVWQMGM